jgi:hypothetical protein
MQKILCVPIFACEQMFIFMPRPNAERDDSTCLAGGVGSSNTPPFLGHHSSVTFWGSIVAYPFSSDDAAGVRVLGFDPDTRARR